MPTPGTIDNSQPFGDITSIIDLIKQIGGTQTDSSGSSETQIGGQANALLTQVLQRLLPGMDNGQFTPEAAVHDSQALVDQIMTAYKESTLPNIYQAERSGGGYNSTTAQLLANDAMAKAAAQGAAQVSTTKEKYAQITNQQQQQLVNVLLGLISGNKKTTNSNTSTSGKPAGSPLSNIGKALGAAAASNAAKKATARPKPTPPAKHDDDNKDDAGASDNASDAVNKQLDAIGNPYQTDEEGGDPGDRVTQDILNSLAGDGANAADASMDESNGLDMTTPDFGNTDTSMDDTFTDGAVDGDLFGNDGNSGNSGDGGDDGTDNFLDDFLGDDSEGVDFSDGFEDFGFADEG
jgi:hypothetical protein